VRNGSNIQCVVLVYLVANHYTDENWSVLSLKICKDILKCLIEDCYTKFGPAKRLINISTTVLHWKLFVAK